MARKRASMREGPLAELFRATEAAQRGQPTPPGEETQPVEAGTGAEAPTDAVAPDEQQTISLPATPPPEPETREVSLEATVEHVYDFEVRDEGSAPEAPPIEPDQAPETPGPTPPAAEPERGWRPVSEDEPAIAARRERPFEPPSSRFVTPMPEGAARLTSPRPASSARTWP